MREFVTDIGNEAERLQRTTEKLLDLSRLDDGVQVVPEPVDVKQVAVDALVLLRPLAAEKNVRLRCDLADGCVVMATTDDMFHIIFNLVENAVKYNVPEGSVTMTLSQTDETVSFEVADTGIGIPEEDRLNVFSRFYRVDKARSREAGGSGLGLSIVHDAVVLHGGTITVGQNKTAWNEIHSELSAPDTRGDRYMNNIKKIQEKLIEKNLDAVLVTDEKNQRYATGFPFTDGAVIVARSAAWLITDSRYIEAATNTGRLLLQCADVRPRAQPPLADPGRTQGSRRGASRRRGGEAEPRRVSRL